MADEKLKYAGEIVSQGIAVFVEWPKKFCLCLTHTDTEKKKQYHMTNVEDGSFPEFSFEDVKTFAEEKSLDDKTYHVLNFIGFVDSVFRNYVDGCKLLTACGGREKSTRKVS